MKVSKFLHHVTLTTGHSRRTYRDEVRDDSVAGAMAMLERARHERVPMPGLGPDMAITVTADGRSAMLATIWQGRAPVVTFGVARNSRASAAVWRLLLRHGPPMVMDESSRPPSPWVAARIEIGAALVSPAIMTAIGGIEAVIAFAFLETTHLKPTTPTTPTGPTVIIGGKKLALRPATREEARRSQANVLRRHAVALANLKNR